MTHVFLCILFIEIRKWCAQEFVSQLLGYKTIKTSADTYLDITEKIEEDELKKFASYTEKKI